MSLICKIIGHRWDYTPWFRKYRCKHCPAAAYPEH